MGDEYTTVKISKLSVIKIVFQVRHQATSNVVKFINRAAVSNALQQFTPRIVPRILINRYHPAQVIYLL